MKQIGVAALLLKLSVTGLASVQGKVNNGLLMVWPRSCFVASGKKISTASRIIQSVWFVSEVIGLKMPADVKRGVEEEREKKDTVKAGNKQACMKESKTGRVVQGEFGRTKK